MLQNDFRTNYRTNFKTITTITTITKKKKNVFFKVFWSGLFQWSECRYIFAYASEPLQDDFRTITKNEKRIFKVWERIVDDRLRRPARVSVRGLRVARFFLVQNTRTGKIYQMTIKYTK
jgi:hypothetical protein